MSESPPFGRRTAAPLLALVLLGLVAAWSSAASPRPQAQGGAGRDYVRWESWTVPSAPGAPLDLALAPGGALYAADAERHAVLAYDQAGALRGTWDHPPIPRDASVAFVPRALVADADRDALYILWQRLDVGLAYAPSGVFLDTRTLAGEVKRQLLWIGGAVPRVRDAALHRPTGDLYLLGDARVHRLRLPAGVIDPAYDLALPLEDRDAERLAVSADGWLALPRPAGRALALYDADGAPAGLALVKDGTPIAVATGPQDGFHTLVRADDPEDPGAPLVVVFAPDGQERDRRSAASLQAPSLPEGAWPWAIDAAFDGLALSAGGIRFRSMVYEGGGTSPRYPALVGSPLMAAFEPGPPGRDGSQLMLAEDADGGFTALDGRDRRLVHYDELGRPRLGVGLPEGTIDLARGDGTFVTTRDGQLLRLGPEDLAPPEWSMDCDCHLGGRVAQAPGVVYVSRPRERAVAAFDARTGARVRDLFLDGGPGMWPADLASLDARLLTADLITAEAQIWTDASAPVTRLAAGLLSGPRRVTARRMEDGARWIAAVMADGYVEIHDLDGGNLVSRWVPRLPGDEPLHVSDVALAPDGRVLLADARRRAIHVFGPGGGIPGTPDPAATQTPTPSALSCTIEGDKRAWPSTIVEGETAEVHLSLRADCPQSARVLGADIALLIDRSGSMEGAPMAAAREAALAFAELLDVRYHRLGLASFAGEASVDVPLTDSVPTVIDGLEDLVPEGETNISAGIARARENLDEFGREEALPVIVLLTDGRHNASAVDPVAVAEQARQAGALVFTIGLGDQIDRASLESIAGHPARAFFAPTPSELFPIYRQILRVVLDSLAGNVIIDDQLADGALYVEDSADPPALREADRLRWGRSVLPSTGISLSYEVRPLWQGCAATNREAAAEYTDADGVRRRYVFPVPTVCVVTPTPTPLSPTPSPMPSPDPIFLPLAQRGHCLVTGQGADVILLVDTSASMAGEKLMQARLAALAFLDQLDLRKDQAAVVGFDDDADVAAPLSRDLGQLEAAVGRLGSGSGTRIDRALVAAIGELLSPRRVRSNRATVILLSDGAHSGPTGSVFGAAAELELLGATIYAIGLGRDADRALLEALSGPERYYPAPRPADLADIYREIARVIPCP